MSSPRANNCVMAPSPWTRPAALIRVMITLRIACSAAPSHNTSLRTEAQTVRLACDRCAVVETDERTYYYHYHGQTAVLRLPCPRPDCRASEQPPGRP